MPPTSPWSAWRNPRACSTDASATPVILSQPEAEIVLSGAQAAYDGQPVLFGVDWPVRAGERVALMGRSGAGKSTLLGLIHAHARARTALIPQAPALVRTLSVFHNVYMGRLDRRSTLHNLRTLAFPARADLAEIRDILGE